MHINASGVHIAQANARSKEFWRNLPVVGSIPQFYRENKAALVCQIPLRLACTAASANLDCRPSCSDSCANQ